MIRVEVSPRLLQDVTLTRAGAQYYQYEVKVAKDSPRADIVARGDLNGDGKESLFTLKVVVAKGSGQLQIRRIWRSSIGEARTNARPGDELPRVLGWPPTGRGRTVRACAAAGRAEPWRN